MSRNCQILILLGLFVLLISLPFLVPGTGFLSLVALVPLLCAEKIASDTGMKRFWIWHYGAFVLWNAATTFWVCNATVGGGIFAVLANALQMSLIFGIFRWSKKYLKGPLPYIFLAVLWIAWERYYFAWAEISWPWLALGNAFARTTEWIQWYEITGTLGGSLWIWAMNICVFYILEKMASKSRDRSFAASCVLAAVLLIVPLGASLALKPVEEPEETLDVVIAQPNINPYNKFGGMSQDQQNIILLKQFSNLPKDAPLLLIAPETFTSDVILNDLNVSPTFSQFRMFLGRHQNANILFGASALTYYEKLDKPSNLVRKVNNTEMYVGSHNTSIMMDDFSHVSLYYKSKLVVGVESMPYPKIFGPIDDMLGGVMGRNIGQKTVTNHEVTVCDSLGNILRTIPVGCAICYESVYGEHCAEYVRKGARFLTVITNDAWWGDTPGYRQHLSYSRLRAIETRRWIARCANTGISAIIDPSGKITSSTSWWKRETLSGKVGLSDTETFFVRYGDWVGRLCVFLAAFLLLATLVRSFLSRKK